MPVSRRQFHHRLVQWGAAASLASPWLARGADAPLR